MNRIFGVTMSTQPCYVCHIGANVMQLFATYVISDRKRNRILSNKIGNIWRKITRTVANFDATDIFLKHDKRQVAACCGCGISPPSKPGHLGLNGKNGINSKTVNPGKDASDAAKGHSPAIPQGPARRCGPKGPPGKPGLVEYTAKDALRGPPGLQGQIGFPGTPGISGRFVIL
uniref:Nematode cuticle collagen N-terminal domain-containing protein n=1 Tax=Onchocerca volvulus TaxID=6282 RepID=A0A8R1TPQ2_ONCVO